MQAVKICRICKVEKELTEFRVDRGYLRGECKACAAELRREFYKQDPERFKTATKKWSRENPEKRNATKRAGYAKNLQRHKGVVRKRLYGITPEDFETLKVAQNNCCAICEKFFIQSPEVDHCHITGKVRGLLCGPCNSGIGMLKDSLLIVLRAALYLQKF